MSTIYFETNLLSLFVLRDITKAALDAHSFNPSPVQIKIDLAGLPVQAIQTINTQLNELIESNMRADSITIDSIHPALKEEFIKYCRSKNQTGEIVIKDNPLWPEFLNMKIHYGDL